MTNKRPTPETDVETMQDEYDHVDSDIGPFTSSNTVPADFARKLERERDEALLELEEYRSIAESVGATKAISEKEKAIRERDELRDILQKLIRINPELECNDFGHKKDEQHSLFEKCPVLERYDAIIKQAESLLKTTK